MDPNNPWYTAWVQGRKSPGDRFAWPVASAAGGEFEVHALLKGTEGGVLTLRAGDASLSARIPAAGWDELDLGKLAIPVGTTLVRQLGDVLRRGPIAAIDKVRTGHTSPTDNLGELLDECRKRDIKVIFYYHWGHGSKDFWSAFWDVPPAGEYARKEKAMQRWLDIITEIGNRYGARLDGWMSDDGRIFYPSPFKLLTAAARAGNPDRMVSFNPWVLPRMSDYEDFAFGEGYQGGAKNLSDGVYTSGKQRGDQAFGNIQTESGDWGLRKGDKAITTVLSQNQFTSISVGAARDRAAMAFDFRMWEDGTQSATSLARFKAAAAAAHAVTGLRLAPGFRASGRLESGRRGDAPGTLWFNAEGRCLGPARAAVRCFTAPAPELPVPSGE